MLLVEDKLDFSTGETLKENQFKFYYTPLDVEKHTYQMNTLTENKLVSRSVITNSKKIGGCAEGLLDPALLDLN